MNGIERITEMIAREAQDKAAAILADAKRQAAEVISNYNTMAQKAADEVLAEGRAQAETRLERMAGAAALEGRKLMLAAKQEVLDDTFALALRQLRALPREEYVALLADLLVKAASTGRETVILNPADRAQVGKEAVTAANERLARAAAPRLPQEVTDTRLGAILDKVVTTGSAIAQGTAMLTLSEETREMTGGFVLQDGPVEVNCTLDALVAQQRAARAAQIAQLLFSET